MSEICVSYDPSNGNVVGKVEITQVEAISKIVDQAKSAAKEWALLDVDERIKYIEEAAKLLASKQGELGELLSREMGKSLNSAIGEVAGCGMDAKARALQVKKAIQPEIINGYGMKTTLQYNPLGVCAVIAPWNYPISMAHWMIIPALTAGNTVVFKPSEETPLIAQEYVDIFNQVLPKNVLQIVHGADEQGKALVESEVDLITFTGSREVGKHIMKKASKTLKRLIMELGGKDPLIVMEDADVDQAARFAIGNSFANAGQMCISTERIYVDNKIVDEFEKKMTEYAKYYKIGPWNDQNANIGPIINDKQRNIILTHIDEAIEKGADVLAGGINHPDRYILPTVLANVTDDMLIAQEETFGPVACITSYTDIDEAIKKANNTKFGLGAAIFGKKNVEEYANRLEAGMVGINQGPGGIGDSPWVGAKQSGFGYHGSPDGHRQFTQVRVVSGS